MNSNKLGKVLVFLLAWVLLTFLIHFTLNSIILGLDFSCYWTAGNSLVEEGLNPYSEQVAERMYYTIAHRVDYPVEQALHFMYPLYVLLIPLPLYFVTIDWASAAWLALNIFAITSIGSLFLTKIPKWLGMSIFLFYEVWFTAIMGNYSLMAFIILLFACFLFLYEKRENMPIEVLCGAAVAWATAKPQMVALFIVLLLLMSYKTKRFGFILGFFSTLLIFIIASFAIVPSWLKEWIESAFIYLQFSPGHQSVLSVYLSTVASKEFTLVINYTLLVLILIGVSYLMYAWYKGKVPSLLVIGVCALVQNMFGPSTMAPNRLLFLIPLILYVYSKNNFTHAKITWWLSILITNLLFALSIAKILPSAGDYYTIFFYIVFLIVMVVDQKKSKFFSDTVPQYS